ncbi:MAG: N-glycosylase/DNA lyase [Nanoarchaeota archaeon]
MKNLNENYKKYKKEIESKLNEFSQLKDKKHFQELLFCILTPQSNAEKCWQAVQELEKCNMEERKVKDCLKTKTRFYKNKTKYLLEANQNWSKIKERLIEENPLELRNWLSENVKGLGLKESSHFLRNIGKSKNELAILDRHILRQLEKLGVIDKETALNRKTYLEVEQKMKNFSKQVNIPLDHLDLLFWKIESGRIFK